MIGVYGSASTSGTGSAWAFYGVGDAYLSGGTWQTSDSRLKENIQPIESALQKIMKLEGKSYDFISRQESKALNLPKGKQYGFIAQDMEKIIPEAVRDIHHPIKVDENNPDKDMEVIYKGVNYQVLTPIIVEAIKEMKQDYDSKITDLEKQIQELKLQLNQQQNNNQK